MKVSAVNITPYNSALPTEKNSNVKNVNNKKKAVKSIRGKIITVDETTPAHSQDKYCEGGFATKNDILYSYIKEQKLINEIHGALVRNKLQDIQQ